MAKKILSACKGFQGRYFQRSKALVQCFAFTCQIIASDLVLSLALVQRALVQRLHISACSARACSALSHQRLFSARLFSASPALAQRLSPPWPIRSACPRRSHSRGGVGGKWPTSIIGARLLETRHNIKFRYLRFQPSLKRHEP